mgnify:CR=1 FL=1
MIRFYYHPTPNPMKISLFLEEAELPYELVPVDTRRGEQHAERNVEALQRVARGPGEPVPGDGHCELHDDEQRHHPVKCDRDIVVAGAVVAGRDPGRGVEGSLVGHRLSLVWGRVRSHRTIVRSRTMARKRDRS